MGVRVGVFAATVLLGVRVGVLAGTVFVPVRVGVLVCVGVRVAVLGGVGVRVGVLVAVSTGTVFVGVRVRVRVGVLGTIRPASMRPFCVVPSGMVITSVNPALRPVGLMSLSEKSASSPLP